MELPNLDNIKKMRPSEQIIIIYMLLVDLKTRIQRLEGFALGTLITIALGFLGGLFYLVGFKRP